MHNFVHVVHRDIKYYNLLIYKNGDLKITDFGLSSICQNFDKFTSTVGSRAFMAPELFRGFL